MARYVHHHAEGASIRLYSSKDKNDEQVFSEQCTKRLFLSLKCLHPNLEFSMLKRTSIICLGWDRLAKIVVSQVEGGKISEVNWINSLFEGAKIDKAAVLARYKLACASAGVDLPWSL